jgi:hypothetical protein
LNAGNDEQYSAGGTVSMRWLCGVFHRAKTLIKIVF